MSDEHYYTRCTSADGSERWFRFAPEALTITAQHNARVLPLRRRGRAAIGLRRAMLVGTWRGAKTILVGTSRRRGVARAGVSGGRR
jgi:hypothetical protein